jgi:hypothetical protein
MRIDISSVAAGVYMLKLLEGAILIHTFQIIK